MILEHKYPVNNIVKDIKMIKIEHYHLMKTKKLLN